MDNWDTVLWAAATALSLVGEVLTVSFFLVFFSFGAAVALCMALLGVPAPLQVIGFILASVLGMVILRPALLNRISLRSSEPYAGHRGITGKSAVVTDAIEPGGNGMVRVGSGEFWTARALYSSERIGPGSRVRVLDTDGLTALVETLEAEGE